MLLKSQEQLSWDFECVNSLQNKAFCVYVLKFKETHVSDGSRTSPSCLHLHYLMFKNV